MEAKLDYSKNDTPYGYKCKRCPAEGVKLWRQYQTFANHIELLCIDCAEKDQKSFCKYSGGAERIRRDYDEIWKRDSYPIRLPNGEIGRSMKLDTPEKNELSMLHMKATSDSIGWLVPAVPTEEDDTYWGYTSVPQPGVEWWQRLPLRK